MHHWGRGNLCAEKHDAKQSFRHSVYEEITILSLEARRNTVIKVSYPILVLVRHLNEERIKEIGVKYYEWSLLMASGKHENFLLSFDHNSSRSRHY